MAYCKSIIACCYIIKEYTVILHTHIIGHRTSSYVVRVRRTTYNTAQQYRSTSTVRRMMTGDFDGKPMILYYSIPYRYVGTLCLPAAAAWFTTTTRRKVQ